MRPQTPPTATDALVPQACLVCGTSDFETVKEFRDGVVVGRCRRCHLLYTPRRHSVPEGLYFGKELQQLLALGAPLLSGERRHYRTRNYREYLKVIGRHAPGRRLLDVGCAHGFFLATAREQNYEVTGVEPSPGMADFAEKALGLRVVRGRLDEAALGQEEWDVVSFTDSLEYVPDPVRALRTVAGHLSPRGILFLKVPNGAYFSVRHAIEKRFGLGLSVDEAFSPSLRVAHYSIATLTRLVREAGLAPLELGASPPIDSPVWRHWTGLDLEMEAPWFMGMSGRIMRRLLHGLGRFEVALTGSTRLAPSIYAVARSPRESSSG